LRRALDSAEITALTGRDPGQRYAALADEFGHPVASSVEAPATAQRKKLFLRRELSGPRTPAARPARGADHRRRGDFACVFTVKALIPETPHV
jgi:phosphoglucomutase